ncbi:zincin-like metallopeptidase toxin domain-containing protein [Chryseobacterium tructae]|nr:zincin-like metallopeptidase toxin domain-containing protein [Chryseobacterium tructae]MDN3695443.1 zincin-like metallopeptidase toxin domain-containing protein [Chryseobacterium tructae]
MRQIDLFPGGSQFEVLSSNLLKKYIRELDKKMIKHNLKLEVVWIDEAHNMYITGLKGRVMVYETGPIKLLIRKNCPKMAWFHEIVHIDDLLKLGRKNYRKMVAEKPWDLEWNVWEEIFKTKNKYREEELVSAYKYVKYFFKENKQPFLENPEMERLILKYSD